METNYTIRIANLSDIDFIVQAIIEAEKSGTEICGFSKCFGLSEIETRTILSNMLEEEIDGCEYSLDSFLICEINETPVAAVAGWLEGKNSCDQPSAILKSNLIGYYMPKKNINIASNLSTIIGGLQIPRSRGALQIEYVYCIPECRGKGICHLLIQEHINRFNAEFVEVQAFDNNKSAIRLYKKLGFVLKQESKSNFFETLDYFPSNKKVLFNKKIIDYGKK